MFSKLNTGVARSASIGVINQVVASATNFGLAVYLVRKLDAASFGLWGICFSVVLLILGLANGLLLTQMVVGLPKRPPWARPAYLRSIFLATVGLGFTVLVCAALFGILINAFTSSRTSGLVTDTNQIGLLVLVTGLAAGCVILLHYFLRQAFSVNKETTALLLNLILVISLAVMLAIHYVTGSAITPTLAMGFYALAHLIAATAGSLLLPVYRRHFRLGLLKRDIVDTWAQGRWAMAGVWVSWGQSQAYVYLTPLFFGLAGLGAVNAARMLVAPLIMLLPAVNQVALPRFANLQVQQPDQLSGSGIRACVVLLVCALAYAAIVGFGFDSLSLVLLGEVRADLFWIAMAWCLMAGLSLIRQIATVMMQAARQFYALFRYEAVVLCVTVGAMTALFKPLGLTAGVLATALGECLIAILVWRHFLSLKESERPAGPPKGTPVASPSQAPN
ncbi:MAG: hypothetical protein WA888_14340 [Burkholderiaceae bacterium]